ncbi:MAG: hypothetical protein Q7S48_00490 [bacterium]|nr:hypothetical protein [bacterium]
MFSKKYHIIHSAKRETRNRGNPFRFQTIGRRPISLRVITAGAVMLAAGLGYWFFLSSAFAIERVLVESHVALPSDTFSQLLEIQLKKTHWKIIGEKNIFAFDTKQFLEALSHEFALENMSVKKDRPHTIVVRISEKPREAVWSVQGKYIVIDAQGKSLGSISEEEAKGKMIIYSKNVSVPENGAQILTPQALVFASNVFQHPDLQTLHPKFILAENDAVSEIALKVGDGWRIYFDTIQDLKTQIENFKLTLQHAVPASERNKLDYIDVRFGRRVYYKLK